MNRLGFTRLEEIEELIKDSKVYMESSWDNVIKYDDAEWLVHRIRKLEKALKLYNPVDKALEE